MPDSPLSVIRRSLGDERGIALPMALGVTMVLSALAAADLRIRDGEPGLREPRPGRPARVRPRGDRPELRALPAPERRRSVQREQRPLDDGFAHGRNHDLWRLALGDDVDADVERDGPEPVGSARRRRRSDRQYAGADHDDHAGGHAPLGLPLRRSARGLHHDGEQRDHGRLALRPRQPLPENNSQI